MPSLILNSNSWKEKMNLKKIFQHGAKSWKNKLSKDEWFFVKLRQQITKGKTPAEAFALLPGAVETVLAQTDETLCLEAFELLFDLTRIADTTELPPIIVERWDELLLHISRFSDYHKRRAKDYARWYRREYI
jgi:hypothetical protein